ncbi:MAG: hypothetical protein GYA87_08970 [Christensenellaceae bacterium]|nr:hypothetical protein [Christensenellaceae bacterium]
MKKSRVVKRKPKTYVDEIKATAVCPFFENASQYSLICKSLIKGARNYTTFTEKDIMQDFANNFCCSLYSMNKCPQNKLLNLYFNIKNARQTAIRAENTLRAIQKNKA